MPNFSHYHYIFYVVVFLLRLRGFCDYFSVQFVFVLCLYLFLKYFNSSQGNTGNHESFCKEIVRTAKLFLTEL